MVLVRHHFVLGDVAVRLRRVVCPGNPGSRNVGLESRVDPIHNLESHQLLPIFPM
jgi:hypothetical protein